MVLVLKEQDVRSVLDMAEGVQVVEASFRQYALGRTALAPRLVMNLSGEAGNFRVMAAVLPEMGGFGLKTLTGTPGKRRSQHTYFSILYFDIDTGALAAVIPASHMTGIRTGAASGVATKYLAREDAKTLGLIGAGFQGKHQVSAMREVRQIERVLIFDVSREPAEALAHALSTEGLEARVVDTAEEAVRGCDVVCSATTAKDPPILGDWLEPGTHVNACGANAPTKREIDDEGFRRSKVIVDFREQVLEEAGDLRHAIEAGAIVPDDIHAELGDVVAGKMAGRDTATDITLFKSVGVAIEDIAVASWVYEQARAKGMGIDLSFQS